MAAELIWSSESLDDIDAIAQFIGRDSLHHAQRVVEGRCCMAGDRWNRSASDSRVERCR
ncbi:MAG: hypothetical protein ACYC42_11055 [Lysobacter sp.]